MNYLAVVGRAGNPSNEKAPGERCRGLFFCEPSGLGPSYRAGLTSYLRYESTFSNRIRELEILATARNFDCPYIWNAHAGDAREAGVSDAIIDAIRERKPLPPMADDERAIVNYCNEFYSNHRVSASTFQIALEQFGTQHLVELTALMSHYSQTAFFLNAFEVDLPADRSEPVLPVG